MGEKSVTTLENVVSNVLAYLPVLLAGLVVLALGFLAAWLAAKLVVRLLVWSRLDRVAQRLGWGGGLEKGDVRHALFGLCGTAVGGLVFLVFLDNALVIWRLTVLSRLLEQVVFLVPELVVATIVLLGGWAVALMASNAVRRALYEEEIERASLIARVVKTAILVLASAIALVQLKLATNIVTYAFLIAFGALALTFVLAFGLGSRRAVESMWEGILTRRGREPGTKEPAETA
jgi:Mechanosensitive ion channel, conserved TM helix